MTSGLFHPKYISFKYLCQIGSCHWLQFSIMHLNCRWKGEFNFWQVAFFQNRNIETLTWLIVNVEFVILSVHICDTDLNLQLSVELLHQFPHSPIQHTYCQSLLKIRKYKSLCYWSIFNYKSEKNKFYQSNQPYLIWAFQYVY